LSTCRVGLPPLSSRQTKGHGRRLPPAACEDDKMTKIKIARPVVELGAGEMTRIIWSFIKNKLI
jgi:hypothetical protein